MEVAPKFGCILPTYLYSAERRAMAERSYASLARTEIPEADRPLRVFVVAVDGPAGDVALKGFAPFFDLQPDTRIWLLKAGAAMGMKVWLQPSGISGPDMAVAWIAEKFFAETDYTHVIELADDMVYNPAWFVALQDLVARHPQARAWSVYRSAHVRHHRTLQQVGGDHLVTSLAGNGTCWTREEWAAWGVTWQSGSWPNPVSGNTLDLHHGYFRPGERWATDKSFMQHIGVTNGLHVVKGIPEHAVNFAGEG